MKNKDYSKYFMPNLDKARKRIQKSEVLKDSFLIPENITNIGKNKTYHIRTYGCQSNIRDSETMKGILEILGYTWIEEIEKADLIILNTCAIRENAENKVFGEIGYLKRVKNNNPNVILGISGCMSQEEGVVNRILSKHDNVDFIIGTHNIHRIPQVLEQVIFSKETVVEVWSKEGDVVENTPVTRDSNIKAWVNITYGCDKFCTYCIVPYTRGKIRSRRKEDILSEVQELVNQGYKDITLLGQNVNSYGIDFEDSEKYLFADLLADVAKLNVPRLRFTTSNPFNWDNRIIDIMRENKNIMPFVHLPIQSGNENILLKMNRKMAISDYLKQINYIKSNIPNVAISTDIIVGFPNETHEEFMDTINLYNEIKFDNAYTFVYSPREGTPAATFKDNVSLEEKKQRLETLNELVRKYAKENNLKYVGQTLEVLVEGISKNNDDVLTGYSENQKVVNFNAKNCKPGDIVKVKILSASRFSLTGEQVE
ncbi:MAG: tRNA (N6-isopentenyl adenosine(37)-C2)-methylthiotransferase MiaB [Ureaplasma sp.]|nr:tRNA (N6-isopentenyl adenosine(37)-C2)-methylthiotransferase MiaB [Ureaplasma sp.]